MMDKKQVKAVIDVLKINTKTGRVGTSLDYIYIIDNWMYASNGYALLALELRGGHEDLELSREDLEKWYKLAGNTSIFTAEDMKPKEQTPPDFATLRNSLEKEFEKSGETSVMFDPSYFKMLMPAFKSAKLEIANAKVRITENGASIRPMTWYLMGQTR